MSSFGQDEGILKKQQYTITREISRGSYGVVYDAYHTHLNQRVAIKSYLEKQNTEGIPPTTLREIALLKEIQHKNVVKLIDVIMQEEKIYLIFEFVQQDLGKYIRSFKTEKLEPALVKKLLHQILSGLSDIHSKRMLHRDIKPANILLDKKQTVKIADFGLARTFCDKTQIFSEGVVTLWYRAPEILLGFRYFTPVDIWSVGCIFAEMISGAPLFPGQKQIDQLNQIYELLGAPDSKNWPQIAKSRLFEQDESKFESTFDAYIGQTLNLDEKGADLLKKMLEYNPNKRISAKQALKHPYFNDYKP